MLMLAFNYLIAQKEFPIWESEIPGQLTSTEYQEYSTGGDSKDILRIHQVVTPS